MKSAIKIQISITIVAIAIAAIHILLPNLKIDTITLVLVIVAVVPWFAPLFKNIELPGGLKFEFQELKKVEMDVRSAGLINEVSIDNLKEYDFVKIAVSNPELALSGLRIELENTLKNLTESKGLPFYTCKGGLVVMDKLYEKKVISYTEKVALTNMIETLNRADHYQEFDPRATQWVINIGPQILDSLNKRLKTSANVYE